MHAWLKKNKSIYHKFHNIICGIYYLSWLLDMKFDYFINGKKTRKKNIYNAVLMIVLCGAYEII